MSELLADMVNPSLRSGVHEHELEALHVLESGEVFLGLLVVGCSVVENRLAEVVHGSSVVKLIMPEPPVIAPAYCSLVFDSEFA